MDGHSMFNSLIAKKANELQSFEQQDNGISFLHHQRDFNSMPKSKFSSTSPASSTMLIQQQSLYMDMAKLLISLLHAWDLDEEVDNVCLNNLKLCRPKLPICFGTISKKGFEVSEVKRLKHYGNNPGHISLYTPHCSGKIAALDDFSHKYFSKNIHWQESRALTTVFANCFYLFIYFDSTFRHICSPLLHFPMPSWPLRANLTSWRSKNHH